MEIGDKTNDLKSNSRISY